MEHHGHFLIHGVSFVVVLVVGAVGVVVVGVEAVVDAVVVVVVVVRVMTCWSGVVRQRQTQHNHLHSSATLPTHSSAVHARIPKVRARQLHVLCGCLGLDVVSPG